METTLSEISRTGLKGSPADPDTPPDDTCKDLFHAYHCSYINPWTFSLEIGNRRPQDMINSSMSSITCIGSDHVTREPDYGPS